MKKRKNRGELSFILGVITLGLGTALTSKAGFGMSTVVAPAYVLSRFVGSIPAGTMCYICQGGLVIVTSLMMGRFRLKYLFSFVSAVLFGLCVDFFAEICLGPVSAVTIGARLAFFVPGTLINALGVALLFHTYFPPQAPELFVQELSHKMGWVLYRTKYAYDLCSCVLSIALSFLLLGRWDFTVLGPGTVVSALVNAPLIGLYGRWLDSIADYGPSVKKLGALFEKE